MLDKSAEKILGKLFLIGLSLTTLVVWSAGVTDPVNVPKFFVVGGVASGLIALLSFKDWQNLLSKSSAVLIFVAIFIVAAISSLIQCKAPFTQSIYGAYGRNNGFLLYLFLSMIFIASLASSKEKTFESLVSALFYSGLANVIYCSWVIVFGDFIGWSNPYGNILGTLGNPNFIGSFLGMFSAVILAQIFSRKLFGLSTVLYFLLLCLTLFLIYKSHAVQGRVLFIAAFFIIFFYFLRSRFESRWPSIIHLGVSGTLSILGALGALQKGPLSGLVYKESVSLRGQYWYAGFQMGKENPLSGVGFDAYGDWYRVVRRSSALIRPGVDITSNTAHNVFIDLFAFGGLPLLLSYLGVIVYVIKSIIVYSRRHRDFDPLFVALVAAWLCYILQSIISINQIGLAIWGWALGGGIIAYTQMQKLTETESVKPLRITSVKVKQKQKIFSPGLRAGIAIIIGLLMSVPPLSADMKWRAAQISRNATQVADALEPSYMNPVSSFRYVSTIGAFIDSQLPDLALRYTEKATKFNSRSFESWRLYTFIETSTESQRLTALRKMKELDPLNPTIMGEKP